MNVFSEFRIHDLNISSKILYVKNDSFMNKASIGRFIKLIGIF